MTRFVDSPMLRLPSRIEITQAASASWKQFSQQQEGYVVALVGESGSGRSATLDLITDEVEADRNDVRIIRLSLEPHVGGIPVRSQFSGTDRCMTGDTNERQVLVILGLQQGARD